MPIYTFYNKKTKKEFDDMMTISEMEEYLKKNKHITQVIKGLNIVASVGNRTRKTDSGWNDTLSKIAEAHPQSALAKERTKSLLNKLRQNKLSQKTKEE